MDLNRAILFFSAVLMAISLRGYGQKIELGIKLPAALATSQGWGSQGLIATGIRYGICVIPSSRHTGLTVIFTHITTCRFVADGRGN